LERLLRVPDRGEALKLLAEQREFSLVEDELPVSVLDVPRPGFAAGFAVAQALVKSPGPRIVVLYA
jgi:hypothetical protein